MTYYEEICSKSRGLDENKQEAVLKYIEELMSDQTGTPSKNKNQDQEECPRKPCPHCGSTNVNKSGFNRGKQRFECKDCHRHYVTTTGTIMENSHYGEDVWQIAVSDTLSENISIDNTAEKAGISHNTAFNMRHKILLVLEAKVQREPAIMSGISELDETYVLECEKGRKFDENAPRKPRKHGAVASKRGISSEQICIMSGVQRGGVVYAKTINRAHPTNDEIKAAFKGHIEAGSVAFTDGLKGYKCLESEVDCVIESVPNDEQKRTANLNNVNGFHSHIQEAYRHYRAVATKYLNRYNALFQSVYRTGKNISHLVRAVLTFDVGNTPFTYFCVHNYELLNI